MMRKVLNHSLKNTPAITSVFVVSGLSCPVLVTSSQLLHLFQLFSTVVDLLMLDFWSLSLCIT